MACCNACEGKESQVIANPINVKNAIMASTAGGSVGTAASDVFGIPGRDGQSLGVTIPVGRPLTQAPVQKPAAAPPKSPAGSTNTDPTKATSGATAAGAIKGRPWWHYALAAAAAGGVIYMVAK